MGIERLLSVIESEGVEIPEPAGPDIFLCSLGDEAKAKVRELTYKLQALGIFAQYDINGRGLKAQMKYADKIRARYTMVIGDGELESGSANLRSMSDKTETPTPLDAEAIKAALK